MGIVLAILALIVVSGSLVAFVRRDAKRNPLRDWHMDAEVES